MLALPESLLERHSLSRFPLRINIVCQLLPAIDMPAVLHAPGVGQMRYIIALIVALFIIGGAILFVHQTWESYHQCVRIVRLRQQKEGRLPPELQGIDIESADANVLGENVSMTLPAALVRRIQITMALTDWWYIWGPLILIVCFGTAALVGAVTKREK